MSVNKSPRFCLFAVTLFLAVAIVASDSPLGKAERSLKKESRQEADEILQDNAETANLDNHRKAIVHHSNYATVRSRGSTRVRGFHNLCRFKRCYPGQKCVVQKGLAKCVCRQHCKTESKPLCGIDGQFYANRCEMHKTACETSRDIYDARNKDCFYKRSECGTADFLAFQAALLELHIGRGSNIQEVTPEQESSSSSRRRRNAHGSQGRAHHHKKRRDHALKELKPDAEISKPEPSHSANQVDVVIRPPIKAVMSEEEDVNRAEDESTELINVVDPMEGLAPELLDPTTVTTEMESKEVDTEAKVHSEMVLETTEVTLSGQEQSDMLLQDTYVNDDVITSDVRGDDLKSLHRYFDLDLDGLIGSEEIHEVNLMDDVDSRIEGPCSLFHLLHYADGNDDKQVDIRELLKIFNVTILHLDADQRVVETTARFGDRVTLQCGIQGEPEPTWKRHNYDLSIYGAEQIQVDGNLVYIDGASPAHSGNYSCEATSRPDVLQTIVLSVLTAPRVEIYPHTQHLVAGNSVSLACHVTGVPPPEITWLINGDDISIENERCIVLANNTEMHINSVDVTDSAAYSCFATSDAGNAEVIGAVFVEEADIQADIAPAIDQQRAAAGAYFVFHDAGILIVTPRSCEVVRHVIASEVVPGLLRQNNLCKTNPLEGVRECSWSSAVSVGARFVYVTQPKENRIIVVDAILQRVVEVIATDPIPASLVYVASSDQLFVLCWVDASRDHSTLQVIYAASVPGSHSAVQIQPLDGGVRADHSVLKFYVPPEGVANARSRHGFVAHKNQQTIQKLDLSTLVYDDDVIDLSPFGCTPEAFSYQPIGGLLHVTCVILEEDFPRSLTVEYESGRVVPPYQRSDFTRQFISPDNRHVVRVFPMEQQLVIFNVTTSGDLREDVVLYTNFPVSDVAFEPSDRNGQAASVYISSQAEGDIMRMGASGFMGIINNLSSPVPTPDFSWGPKNRALVSSGWYDRHLAVSGLNGVDIIDLGSGSVRCHLNDVKGPTTIVWAGGEN